MQFSTVITMGDLNVDKLKVNGREAKLLRDIEEVFELTCLVTEPTRITDTSQTLLDVLLTNQPDLFKNAGVSDIGLSDHCMVYGFLKETVKKHTADIITCRSFKNLDMEEFKKDLEEAVWFKQNVTEVDKLYDNWYTELMRIVDKHLPLKRVKARKIDVPYMTGEWKEAIRKKRKYAKKFSQSKTKENMELMKKWRNNATRLRRKAIKMTAELLATPLTTIFNQAIEENRWPSAWKRGEWIPIYKKEDPLGKVNYRPVTVLTAVDKVFEQLICRQLSEMFEPIFDTFLSAYRKHFSCETTLIRLTEDWKHAADKGHASVILSTDISKAFDSLHPNLLLAKLKAYGLSDPALGLMRSYFDDRENRTRVGNYTSAWKAVKRGFPQGSSLGPLLWNVYQNHLFYTGVKSQLSAYADDQLQIELRKMGKRQIFCKAIMANTKQWL